MNSCAVTAQLICAFAFAYADCLFSDAAAQISVMKIDRTCSAFRMAGGCVVFRSVCLNSSSSFSYVHICLL